MEEKVALPVLVQEEFSIKPPHEDRRRLLVQTINTKFSQVKSPTPLAAHLHWLPEEYN